MIRRARAAIVTLWLGLAVAGCTDDQRAVEVAFAPARALLPKLADPDELVGTSSIVPLTDAEGDAAFVIAEPYARRVQIAANCTETCATRVLTTAANIPVRTALADMDGDGHDELVIADIGSLWAEETKVGRIVLVDDPTGAAAAKVIAKGLKRVACVVPADLDGDGDKDVVVCEFGHTKGRLLWLEQRAASTWKLHVLEPRVGSLAAAVFDADGDGDLDVAAAFAQNEERVMVYRGDGSGGFEPSELFRSPEPCFGMSSLRATDLDGDGDPDIVFTNGDMMDPSCRNLASTKLHGVHVLRNDGGTFAHRKLAAMYGVYATEVADLDKDGDADLLALSFQDPFFTVGEAGPQLVWLEQRAGGDFAPHTIETGVGPFITMARADVDSDGRVDLLLGSMEAQVKVPGSTRMTWLRRLP